jgi:hypothetical protein
MANAVFGIARSLGQATQIVGDLKAAGFSGHDISVLFPDREGTRDFAHEENTKAPEGAAAGVSAGGAVGGVLGLLAGIGALAIPGVGPFIAAGPILAALSGGAVGAAVGGLTGTLIGLGIPELEARVYEGHLKSGNILIAVYAEDRDEVRRAKEILQDGGADDVATGSAKKAPDADETDKDFRERTTGH